MNDLSDGCDKILKTPYSIYRTWCSTSEPRTSVCAEIETYNYVKKVFILLTNVSRNKWQIANLANQLAVKGKIFGILTKEETWSCGSYTVHRTCTHVHKVLLVLIMVSVFQRAMETYQRWREVQRNLKEEDTEMLKRKISLQLQLIRQQHALAEQRRLQEQEDLKQVRKQK